MGLYRPVSCDNMELIYHGFPADICLNQQLQNNHWITYEVEYLDNILHTDSDVYKLR